MPYYHLRTPVGQKQFDKSVKRYEDKHVLSPDQYSASMSAAVRLLTTMLFRNQLKRNTECYFTYPYLNMNWNRINPFK